jgi:hypothetical protein
MHASLEIFKGLYGKRAEREIRKGSSRRTFAMHAEQLDRTADTLQFFAAFDELLAAILHVYKEVIAVGFALDGSISKHDYGRRRSTSDHSLSD